ncbi:hypothetical protein H5410_023490 [Solanum commersonii]|uniref:Uncharacterized protein n=1 Tax=Solanum commersonii TaxID=4109 RepID=A0A9J5ZH06_SOLCO|nr:hypothetical protein H5410_023490 [Solanum commersonii]
MRKIRNLKEEHEQKLHDVIQNKAKQFEKMKHEFEAKIANLDQQLLRSAAENSALSSSLQERSNMVIKLSEEKSQAEAEIEIFANKQHLERVKKIAKLEAECKRLRGLVRKKLLGPAALSQMKLEVESLGRHYGNSCVKKSQGRPSIVHKVQENEQLTEHLLAMEEETKMLKEALADRNSELQASRSICAKTSSKLQSLQAQLLNRKAHKSPPFDDSL